MLRIDYHEPVEIVRCLKPLINIEVSRLKYGDYYFLDVVIERKTISDFFSSLRDGRLEEQMGAMSRCCGERYLLIEGFFDFTYVNNIGYLYSELAKVVINFEIKVIFSKDYGHTAEIIRRLYLQRHIGYMPITIKRDKMYHASKLFGISKNKIEILLSRFGSISNIAKAEKRELKGIKKIGKRTIETVKKVLEENIKGVF